MEIILRQMFPLGRFHATPWRVNPFDDAHGEWPPSPWRLVRAVVARWYQSAREDQRTPDFQQLDDLINALCTSAYRFHLPNYARRGSPLRQYFPAEFGWNPKAKKKAAVRAYGTSLAQDNYWCVPAGDGGAVWWFIDGEHWTDALAAVLDRCLERITYFGRAETFTRIRRASEQAPQPNCELRDHRAPDSVPILAPLPDAARSDVERVTDDPFAAGRSVPPGACSMYALRPARPLALETPHAPLVLREPRLIQFAIAWSVPPEPHAVVRLTARFRRAVLRELLRIKTGGLRETWDSADDSVRDAVADMVGKDARGMPLTGHRHAEFLAWCENGRPTRLVVWRSVRPFDEHEQGAIGLAAAYEFSWAAAGPDADAWKVRLVPLDAAVQPPPGFDGSSARCWESVTPYVPTRHYLRDGKPRARESLLAQIRRELMARGVAGAEQVEAQQIADASWVTVHVPPQQRQKSAFLGDRRGYSIRLVFGEPVEGPMRLGHSSSLGLGLFRPVLEVTET